MKSIKTTNKGEARRGRVLANKIPYAVLVDKERVGEVWSDREMSNIELSRAAQKFADTHHIYGAGVTLKRLKELKNDKA